MGDWIGFLGLVLDFIGVVILTLDILPEFILARRRRRLHQLGRNTKHLQTGAADSEIGDDPRRQTLEGMLDLVHASNASLYRDEPFTVGSARFALKMASHGLDLESNPEIVAATAPGPFNRELFDRAMRVVGDGLEHSVGSFELRKRPNIYWGVAMILFGFALQAWAATPQYGRDWIARWFWWLIGAPPS